MSPPPTTTLLSAQLANTKGLTATTPWLTTFLKTQRPTTPLPALTQTACFRLLATDITASLCQSATTCFPPDVQSVGVRERRLVGPVAVQVLGVEDVGKSRWEQIEAIEAVERGEGMKGREIVRVGGAEEEEEEEGGGGGEGVVKGGGPHKLALQDAGGCRVYGIELKGVEGVGVGMSMGCKMVLRNVVVARGMVLLEPGTVTVLGGKIEGLHEVWKEGRKAELRAAIEASERGR